MRWQLCSLVLCCLVLCCPPCWASDEPQAPPALLTHVTFVSGNRERRDQAFWMTRIGHVLAGQQGTAAPHTDLLLWLGDALYADVSEAGVELSEPGPLGAMEAKYRAMHEANEAYKMFVSQVVRPPRGRVIGVWDGHDIGLRTANKTYAHLPRVKELYLDHIFTAEQDRAAVRGHGGLYHFARLPAPPHSRLARHFVYSVCTVTLDLYTFREAMPDLPSALLHPYEPPSNSHNRNTEQSIWAEEHMLLGQEQWHWLRNLTQRYLASAARAKDGRRWCAMTLLASPWQVLLNDNKPFLGWDLYPGARSRLLALFKHYRVARLIVLSGHAESGELGLLRGLAPAAVAARDRTRNPAFPLAVTRAAATLLPPYPSYLVEATSSGLTHSITETSFFGRLYKWFVPSDCERDPDGVRLAAYEELPTLMPRYFDVQRRVGLERNFGSVVLLDMDPQAGTRSGDTNHTEDKEEDARRVMHSTKVVLTVHSLVSDNSLFDLTAVLADLPSYELNVSATLNARGERVHDDGDPLAFNATQFYVYNAPGDYPMLKRLLLNWQCAELPCVPGRFRVFGVVLSTLAMAFVAIVVLFAAIVYCNRGTLGEPEVVLIQRPRKMKED